MSMTEAPASVLFSRDAAGYDDLRRRLVPCFDDFYGSALMLIRDCQIGPDIDVLDLGAGTGLFSTMVLAHCQVGRLCLLDGSAGMLEQSRARFLGIDRVEYRLADMVDANLGGPWDIGPCDPSSFGRAKVRSVSTHSPCLEAGRSVRERRASCRSEFDRRRALLKDMA
jgi:SAM-dependent methyltransferase